MAGGSGQCVPVAITGSGGQDVRAVDEVPDKLVLIFQEPAENWLIYLQLSPRCIKKMSSRFGFGRNSYLDVLSCAYQIFSGSLDALVLGPADLTASLCPLPLSLPPSLGNPLSVQAGSFTLTHYIFCQIFCRNTRVLSAPHEAQAFETQKLSIHSSLLSSL